MVHGLFLTLVNVIEIHEKNSAHFKYENTFASGCVVMTVGMCAPYILKEPFFFL